MNSRKLLFVLVFILPFNLFGQSAQDYYKSAMIKFVSHRYDEAVQDFTKAIKLNPDYVDAYFNRGIAYEQLGSTDKAIKDYGKVIKIKPGMNEAYINRALLYKKSEKYSLAIKDLDKAIELRPDFVFAFLYRADIYYTIDSLSLAVKDYKVVLAKLPNYIKAHRRMAEILYKQNQFPEALEYASKLCELESDKAGNFLLRAEILIALQRFEPACKDLARAKELGSEAAKPLATKYCK